MKYIDYLFLRIFRWYEKREKFIPLFASHSFLTVVITVTLLNIFYFIENLTRFTIPTFNKLNFFIIMVIIFVCVFMLFNKKRLEMIKQNYIDEPLNLKKKRGWIIVGYLLIIILYPIISAYIEHNLS